VVFEIRVGRGSKNGTKIERYRAIYSEIGDLN